MVTQYQSTQANSCSCLCFLQLHPCLLPCPSKERGKELAQLACPTAGSNVVLMFWAALLHWCALFVAQLRWRRHRLMSDPNHPPTASVLCSTSLHLGGELESSPPSLPLSPKASASFSYSSRLDSLAFTEFLRFCLELFKTWRPEACTAHRSVKLCGQNP